MLFNSYFFVLVFLPLAVGGYYLIDRTGKYRCSSLFLLILSMWFYAYVNIAYLPVLVGSILLNYLAYLGMMQSAEKPVAIRRGILAATIIADLGILAYFKYYDFIVDSMNLVFRTDLAIKDILLPMGISFMTFRQIAFVVDAYRGDIKKCGPIEYALFIAFFPTLLSGPIITYDDFFPLLRDEKRKRIDWDGISAGIYLFAMGMGKKVLLADVFGRAVDAGYDSIMELNATSVLVVSLAYTLQIYFDFSGYSDMAIGVSRMLGLDLPMNFDSPYKSRTIIEFWDRWHMTLTRFLTRYLYIPLGGSRKGEVRTYLNTMIVFLCSGLWHGAGWTYIAWGFLHGLFLVFTKRFRSRVERIPDIWNRAVTFLFVNATWILFRAESFGTAKRMFRILFSMDRGSVHGSVCDAFYGSFAAWLPLLQPWGVVLIYLLAGLSFCLFCKNTEERLQTVRFDLRTGILVVAVLFFSLMSFSSVTTYVYAVF